MAFRKLEEFTAPLRFLFLTGHFVMLLTVTLDVINVTKTMDGSPDYSSTKNMLTYFSYAALAACAIEYIGMFSGVSMFVRTLTVLNIAAHAAGVTLVAFFYYRHWALNYYISYVVVFSFVPAAVELTCLAYLASFAFGNY